ncbi:hypothetical protein ANCCAN_11389 [Ancylostoma caninum]|uniref:Uncharacterized protein n=1 Tax=Ancylostoma caninum TaxID=29170 RepID=A0A368GG40_ANCCA|nr:hypothetical protein ANCCAN_11389 [Ancylostoma caninum]
MLQLLQPQSPVVAASSHNGDGYSKLTSAELIMARNSDPVINKMLLALSEKAKVECLAMIEYEKRGRSIVLDGMEEAPADVSPSMRMKNLETKVENVLSALQMECRPSELYRMGKFDPKRPRLVKIVFSSKLYWSLGLTNARLLKLAGYPDLFIRRSMTEIESQKDYELHQLATERNRERCFKEWVVYRGRTSWCCKMKSLHYPSWWSLCGRYGCSYLPLLLRPILLLVSPCGLLLSLLCTILRAR